MKPAEIPLVRFGIPFIAGILVAMHYPVSGRICLFLLFVLFTLSILYAILPQVFRLKQNWMAGMILMLIFFGGGLYRMNTATSARKNKRTIIGTQMSMVMVTGYPEARAKTYRFPARIDQYYNEGWHHPERSNIMVYIFKQDPHINRIRPGTQLWIKGVIRPFTYRRNPGEFDYRKFMADHHIYGQVMVDSLSWGSTGNKRKVTLSGLAADLQHAIVQKLSSSGFNDRELAVAAALMAGERTMLDPETKQLFSRSGAMHVLAISGLHIGILYYVLFSLLAFLHKTKYGRFLRFFLVVGVIWCYVFVTGLPSSGVRAATMFSFFSLGELLSRKAHPMNILAASALLMLFVDPYLIRSAGFLLSYLAVTGIILFYHPIKTVLLTGYVIPDRIVSLFAVSMAAQIGTAPLSVYYFHQFPVWFALTNLLVIPLVTLIVYGFLLWLITLPVGFLSGAVVWALKLCISLLLRLVTLFHHLPLQIIGNLHPGSLQVILWYIVVFSVTFFLLYRKTIGFYLFQVALIGLALIGYVASAFPEKQCIFYDIPQRSVIGLKIDRHTLILDCSRPPKPANDLEYYTGSTVTYVYQVNNENHMVIREDGRENTERLIYWNRGFFSMDGLTGYHFESSYPARLRTTASKVKLDVLLFSGNRWWNLLPLLKELTFGEVILDSTVPGYAASQIQFICREHEIPCYRLKDQGALVIRI